MLKAIIAFSVLQLSWCLLLGGYSSQEVTADVEQLARQVLPLMQSDIPGEHLFVIESIQSYETQVVSGINHKYRLVMVETTCLENTQLTDMASCAQPSTAKRLTCEVVVYVPFGDASLEVQKTECQTGQVNPLNTRKLSAQKRKLKKKAFLHGLDSGHHRDSPVPHLTAKRLFNDFVQRFDRKYLSTKEFRRRRRIFADNLEAAHMFQKAERGTARYGVTKFSDLTVDEWRSQYLGLDAKRGRPAPDGRFRQTAQIPDVTDMPTEFDWRTKGAVTPVKNQGQCGSCWAFSVTGNVEGQYFIKHKKLLSLSEQELVDCDTDDHGCQGGLPDQAYKFIEFLGGLETESEYPYEERNAKCRLNRTDLHVKLSGSLDLPKNEKDIQKWLYANGPVSIGVNANPLMFYKGGIIDIWSFLCKASGIDHGVLLVGFGEHDFPVVQKKKPFWIIKNSWGGDWGEQGYFRLIRGTDECGVQDMASSSIVV